MPKKVSATHSANAPAAAAEGKLVVTEHPAEGAAPTAQHVQQTLDAHLKPPASSTLGEEEDGGVVMLEGEPLCTVLDEVEEGLGDARLAGAFKDLSLEERHRILVEVAQKNALQRRDKAIALLHTRRAENLLRQVFMFACFCVPPFPMRLIITRRKADEKLTRAHTQVEMREKRRGLLARKVREYKEGLRERIAVALSEEDRSIAQQELNALKKALRDIDNPLSRHDARLERMVAGYDSDKDVVVRADMCW
jgi:hypothetical protein